MQPDFWDEVDRVRRDLLIEMEQEVAEITRDNERREAALIIAARECLHRANALIEKISTENPINGADTIAELTRIADESRELIR